MPFAADLRARVLRHGRCAHRPAAIGLGIMLILHHLTSGVSMQNSSRSAVLWLVAALLFVLAGVLGRQWAFFGVAFLFVVVAIATHRAGRQRR